MSYFLQNLKPNLEFFSLNSILQINPLINYDHGKLHIL